MAQIRSKEWHTASLAAILVLESIWALCAHAALRAAKVL